VGLVRQRRQVGGRGGDRDVLGQGIDPINSCSDVNDFGDLIYCEDWDRISYSPDGRRRMWDMTATAGNEVIALANADGGALQVIDHGSTENDFQPPFLRMATGSPMSGARSARRADRHQRPPRRRCSRRHDDDHRLQPLSWQPVR
jgi:hypothetical protein